MLWKIMQTNKQEKPYDGKIGNNLISPKQFFTLTPKFASSFKSWFAPGQSFSSIKTTVLTSCKNSTNNLEGTETL